MLPVTTVVLVILPLHTQRIILFTTAPDIQAGLLAGDGGDGDLRHGMVNSHVQFTAASITGEREPDTQDYII